MKITLVLNKNDYRFDDVYQASKGFDIDLTTVSFENINKSYDEILDGFGDVVLWKRDSSILELGKNWRIFKGAITKKLLDSGKFIINRGAILNYELAFKYYQQKTIKSNKFVNTIKTYLANNFNQLNKLLDLGLLKYPFIMKPNCSSKGNGVLLINSILDITNNTINKNLKDYVFQNYIENDGDYRAIVLGHKVLGIIKRTRDKHGFLNNFSKGGNVSLLDDINLYKNIERFALRTSASLELNFVGIDFIVDKKDDSLYFLELNQFPQWSGFESVYKNINVAKELIKFCTVLYGRKENNSLKIVRDYYDDNFFDLMYNKFHYASRMYLWTKDKKYFDMLEFLKPSYIGKDSISLKEMISKIINFEGKKSKNCVELRGPYFDKYNKLLRFNSLLFINLFAKTIYSVDIKEEISEFVKDEELLLLKDALLSDKDAIRILSTHAINYIYNLGFYFNDNFSDENLFYELGSNYEGKSFDHLKLRIYLLTHCIIGASNFYQHKVTHNKDVYVKMLKLIEAIISGNYFNVMMDNKFEFLVCCKLLDYNSCLEGIILSEGASSLSQSGNYIVDTLNNVKYTSRDFVSSEHRNVLFLIANLEYKS